NRRQMTDPFGGNVYYWYDDLNRLSSVGQTLEDVDTTFEDHDVEYTYYKNGQMKTIQQKNGVTSNFTYDGFRLDALTHKKSDGTVLNAYAYNYDNNGNITNRVENGSSKTFTYDNLNRVVTSDVQSQTFGYDVRGNRNSFTSENPTESPDATYEYNSRDQLVKVTTVAGKIVNYKYNGDGLLTERIENGVTTRLYYDGGSVIAEGTVSGGTVALKARYIRGSGLVARQDANAEKSYYLQNGHGDVVELRDSTGNTRLNQYTYDIWGNPLTATEFVAQPFRYSGEYWDSVASLQYLRARWYDPSIGRFINEDTYEGQISNPLSLNLYTYVHNNPLIYSDPTGHAAIGQSTAVFEINKKISDAKISYERAKKDGNTDGMKQQSAIAVGLRTEAAKTLTADEQKQILTADDDPFLYHQFQDPKTKEVSTIGLDVRGNVIYEEQENYSYTTQQNTTSTVEKWNAELGKAAIGVYIGYAITSSAVWTTISGISAGVILPGDPDIGTTTTMIWRTDSNGNNQNFVIESEGNVGIKMTKYWTKTWWDEFKEMFF
ncbi:RHS repeat domain-containing protein, partial [Paenibacillus koleovorans]|uniref:RHS repeat domain-containing protein n=1 Tax=Paenibacillus koleovorans TaxID=121608 RepID=UPI0013E34E67